MTANNKTRKIPKMLDSVIRSCSGDPHTVLHLSAGSYASRIHPDPDAPIRSLDELPLGLPATILQLDATGSVSDLTVIFSKGVVYRRSQNTSTIFIPKNGKVVIRSDLVRIPDISEHCFPTMVEVEYLSTGRLVYIRDPLIAPKANDIKPPLRPIITRREMLRSLLRTAEPDPNHQHDDPTIEIISDHHNLTHSPLSPWPNKIGLWLTPAQNNPDQNWKGVPGARLDARSGVWYLPYDNLDELVDTPSGPVIIEADDGVIALRPRQPETISIEVPNDLERLLYQHGVDPLHFEGLPPNSYAAPSLPVMHAYPVLDFLPITFPACTIKIMKWRMQLNLYLYTLFSSSQGQGLVPDLSKIDQPDIYTMPFSLHGRDTTIIVGNKPSDVRPDPINITRKRNELLDALAPCWIVDESGDKPWACTIQIESRGIPNAQEPETVIWIDFADPYYETQERSFAQGIQSWMKGPRRMPFDQAVHPDYLRRLADIVPYLEVAYDDSRIFFKSIVYGALSLPDPRLKIETDHGITPDPIAAPRPDDIDHFEINGADYWPDLPGDAVPEFDDQNEFAAPELDIVIPLSTETSEALNGILTAINAMALNIVPHAIRGGLSARQLEATLNILEAIQDRTYTIRIGTSNPPPLEILNTCIGLVRSEWARAHVGERHYAQDPHPHSGDR